MHTDSFPEFSLSYLSKTPNMAKKIPPEAWSFDEFSFFLICANLKLGKSASVECMIRVTRVSLLLVSFCHEIHGIFWTINPRSKKCCRSARYQYNCRPLVVKRWIYCLFSNAIFGCALSQRELSLLRQLLLIIATRDHLGNAIGLFQSCKGQN